MGLIQFAPFWLALLVSAFAAGPILRRLVAWKSRQTISQFAPEGHQKKQGTPTMGGLIIAAGALSTPVLLFIAPKQDASVVSGFAQAVALFAGFAAIGFIDDFVVPRIWAGKRGLGWKQKIALQALLGGLVAVWTFPGRPLEIGIAAFLILFFSNAYNFSDGLDGLAGSLLLGLLFGFYLLIPYHPVYHSVCLALAGATLPFLFLNAPPAKVFMGDVGSLPIGAVLGWLASLVLLGKAGHGGLDQTPGIRPEMVGPIVVLSLVMIAELVPVPIQIFWVKVFKKRLFPYTPIHHAFEKAGWPETRVVALFVLIQLVVSMAALTWALGVNEIVSFDAVVRLR